MGGGNGNRKSDCELRMIAINLNPKISNKVLSLMDKNGLGLFGKINYSSRGKHKKAFSFCLQLPAETLAFLYVFPQVWKGAKK